MLTVLGQIRPCDGFTVLREVSQHTNVKLSTIAEHILELRAGCGVARGIPEGTPGDGGPSWSWRSLGSTGWRRLTRVHAGGLSRRPHPLRSPRRSPASRRPDAATRVSTRQGHTPVSDACAGDPAGRSRRRVS
ncbi:hypothetical protein ABZ800_35595 [Streptomyces sp. NPDC047813]|uniref:hypothetical protein n=1 Tax=Streptomyces sp. NPDC047813 TaxID=3154608 RepID=UPI0033F50A36